MRLIDADALMQFPIRKDNCDKKNANEHFMMGIESVLEYAECLPTVDAVEVVRCKNCVHAEPLDRNCEISTSHYMHCKLYRGEETKNVWHKYKKYYKDYSLVERDGFCSDGAKMDGDGNG